MILCQNCNKREGTETWVGDGGAIGWIHGAYQMWCKVCCLEAQLKHARAMAAQIPQLEEELGKLT